MCPACVASAAVVAGGVVSSGGITALALRVLRRGKNKAEDVTTIERRENDGNGNKQ